MNKKARIIIVAVVVLAVAAALGLKNSGGGASEAGAATRQGIPRLVDLGASQCIPCRMMAPILDELREEYAGRFDVIFIDVWQDRGAGQTYGIRAIPTQIFYDAKGDELFRHEGFMSKQDILSRWAALGFAF